jgi:hypothetical protein
VAHDVSNFDIRAGEVATNQTTLTAKQYLLFLRLSAILAFAVFNRCSSWPLAQKPKRVILLVLSAVGEGNQAPRLGGKAAAGQL